VQEQRQEYEKEEKREQRQMESLLVHDTRDWEQENILVLVWMNSYHPHVQ
jgi:hypothetical protein